MRSEGVPASWLGAHPARLIIDGNRSGGSTASESESSFESVNLPGMQHPLLLQRYLPPLPRGGKVGAAEETEGWGGGEEETNGGGGGGGGGGEGGSEGEGEGEGGEGEGGEGGVIWSRTRSEVTAVVPVDFVVPPGTSLVAITGPNTVRRWCAFERSFDP